MKLEHDFFHVSKLSENQKKEKRSSPKIEKFLSVKSRKDQNKGPHIIQRSDADRSQIIGWDADVDHCQIIGGIYSSRVSEPIADVVT